jgi:N-acetylmuramoyl-L-alanine amidase
MIKIDPLKEKIFFNNIFKIGFTKKKPKNIKKDKFLILLAQAFQRRFRQELINGKIDNECLLISENLIKKLN